MCDTETRSPIDAYAIAIDETHYYTIKDCDEPYIAQIRGVFLFDRNARTHLCELTPSYWLIHLYTQVILTDDAEALSEAEIEAIYERYEQCASEDEYVHCHTIDTVLDRNERSTVDHYGATEVSYDDTDYAEQMESLREDFCGNCPF